MNFYEVDHAGREYTLERLSNLGSGGDAESQQGRQLGKGGFWKRCKGPFPGRIKPVLVNHYRSGTQTTTTPLSRAERTKSISGDMVLKSKRTSTSDSKELVNRRSKSAQYTTQKLNAWKLENIEIKLEKVNSESNFPAPQKQESRDEFEQKTDNKPKTEAINNGDKEVDLFVNHLESSEIKIPSNEEVDTNLSHSQYKMYSNDSLLSSSSRDSIRKKQEKKQKTLRARSMPLLNADTDGNYTSSKEKIKFEKFKLLLSQSQVNIEELRKLSWAGIPQQVRPMTWMLLSGYLPAKTSRREETLRRKRAEYQGFVEQYFATHSQSKENEAIYHQIEIDIPRTDPDIPLFQQPTVQQIYLRILYTWAIRHPASGYVQGINDLLSPFFFVFLSEIITEDDIYSYDISCINKQLLDTIEADMFWCMSKLLDRIHDNYVCSQPGIQRKVNKLSGLIRLIDEPLDIHLQAVGVNYLDFAFRWMNCLLIRELSYFCVKRMFDTYHAESDDFSELHLYVCVAFLVNWSGEIQKFDDFHDVITFIQNLQEKTINWTHNDIEMILAQAFVWKAQYHNSTRLS